MPCGRGGQAGYGRSGTDELVNNPDLLIRVAQELKQEKELRRELQEKVEKDKPKTLFADAVSASSISILIGEFAKILKSNGYDTGENTHTDGHVAVNKTTKVTGKGQQYFINKFLAEKAS